MSLGSDMVKVGMYDSGGWHELNDCINAMRQRLGRHPILTSSEPKDAAAAVADPAGHARYAGSSAAR